MPAGRSRRGRRLGGTLLILTVLVFAAAGLARLAKDETSVGGAAAVPPSLGLEVRAGERILQRLDLSAALREDGTIDPARLRRALARTLAPGWQVRTGRARIRYSLDRARALRRILAAGPVPVVRIGATARSSTIQAPVVAQKLRNNCESAALEVLLATVGSRRPQLTLQADLPTSGGPDPVNGPDGRVWGDPDLGYVGRPDGGGVAGGFGVYQAPVRAVAARAGVELEDISGTRLSTVLARLRAGRAVMVWVGLSDGPYGRWSSPAGRPIRVNFNEHTVVLTGVDAAGRVSLVNVLKGTRETWTQGELLVMWRRLDWRALAAPARP